MFDFDCCIQKINRYYHLITLKMKLIFLLNSNKSLHFIWLRLHNMQAEQKCTKNISTLYDNEWLQRRYLSFVLDETVIFLLIFILTMIHIETGKRLYLILPLFMIDSNKMLNVLLSSVILKLLVTFYFFYSNRMNFKTKIKIYCTYNKNKNIENCK